MIRQQKNHITVLENKQNQKFSPIVQRMKCRILIKKVMVYLINKNNRRQIILPQRYENLVAYNLSVVGTIDLQELGSLYADKMIDVICEELDGRCHFVRVSGSKFKRDLDLNKVYDTQQCSCGVILARQCDKTVSHFNDRGNLS